MGEYKPAPYLVRASSLTEEQLKHCYQDFTHSLEYAAAAPTLVFERLVTNIVDSLKANEKDVPNQSANDEARTPAPPASPPPNISMAPPDQPLQERSRGDSYAVKCPRRPATGTFHTREVLPANGNGYIDASKLITFSQPYTSAPRIVTGLRSLILSSDLCFNSYARNIMPTTFSIHAWTHCHACIPWLQISPEDKDFQVGTFSTTEDQPYHDPKKEVFRRVLFEREYQKPPQVAVWISGLQIDCSRGHGVETRCQDVTSTGFLLCVSIAGVMPSLFSAEVSWAACSFNKPNTFMGTFKQPENGQENGLHDLAGNSNFKEESTSIFLAINSITIDTLRDFNLNVSWKKVDKEGLSWCISTSGHSKLTQVGVSFIVLG